MVKNREDLCKNNHKKSFPVSELCIVHEPLLLEHGSFVSSISCKSDPNDKLKHLREIYNLRSYQPVNSSGRMKNICEKVSATLKGLSPEKNRLP